jgi:hypothetical protein
MEEIIRVIRSEVPCQPDLATHNSTCRPVSSFSFIQSLTSSTHSNEHAAVKLIDKVHPAGHVRRRRPLLIPLLCAEIKD